MENPLKVSLENIIPLTEARDHFSQIVNEVQKDKLYVLTKGGKPAVAIVDVKYLEHITGGEAKVENVREEIKKAPEKVGLPPMIEHPKVAPNPIPPPPLVTPPMPPKMAPPEPAGFAAPQPPPPQPKPPTPPTPVPAPVPTQPPPPINPAPQPARNASSIADAGGPKPLTPAPQGEKIDIQFSKEPPPEDKKKIENEYSAPDDKNPPGQYAGNNQEEPEDMSID